MGLKCKIAPSRGFTWINPSGLWNWREIKCGKSETGICENCAMNSISKMDHVGLLFVGEKFYPTPQDFDKESRALGISRRLPHDHLPRGFKVGEDFIMLAHRKGVVKPSVDTGEMFDYAPAVFRVFRPDRIECVVTGDESDDYIEALTERGITPVIVKKNE
jgi:hypothetical protein